MDRRACEGMDSNRPTADIRCPDLVAPKLPVEPARRHVPEVNEQGVHVYQAALRAMQAQRKA
jgi:hypothetical protein